MTPWPQRHSDLRQWDRNPPTWRGEDASPVIPAQEDVSTHTEFCESQGISSEALQW